MGTCGCFAVDGVDESLTGAVAWVKAVGFAGTLVLEVVFTGGGGSLPYEDLDDDFVDVDADA
jgi:hypothetical protein